MIKGGSVFFTVVSSLKYAVQTDRNNKVLWVSCICHFFFVPLYINHLYQIFLVTSVSYVLISSLNVFIFTVPFLFKTLYSSLPSLSCHQLQATQLLKVSLEGPFQFLSISAQSSLFLMAPSNNLASSGLSLQKYSTLKSDFIKLKQIQHKTLFILFSFVFCSSDCSVQLWLNTSVSCFLNNSRKYCFLQTSDLPASLLAIVALMKFKMTV